ncbi:Bug family tripartite tricarboxylate transporter substrate binding protein [Diaphorobacter caeni]|uniref:Bug family tripartite tricarboxylate transporter substrate binding protein n=1 Tax=Diaphorobacter caeni TaxID=2784387 RepID=UPI001E3212FA|nr:tripartite tricarboxylate transporter substrate binding protein [Diaphorobacter caeni]
MTKALHHTMKPPRFQLRFPLRFQLRFRFAAIALAAAVPMLTSLPVSAESWPSRPVKLVVPFPPGGAADAIGRYYADKLTRALGQPVIVDNKAGAGTAIAAEYVARAAPDGYTISLATSGQLTVLPHLQSNLRFDPVKDFTPVSLVASVHNVVAINPKLQIHSLPELLARAKANPGKVTYSSCGSGTLCHLTGELLQNLSGSELLHVPYKGSAPAVTAALGGEVDLAIDTLTVLAPQIRAGKLQGLVQTAATRSPQLPDVPSAPEAGLPSFISSGWFGVVVPANTPAPIVARLQKELHTIARAPQTDHDLQERGISVEYNTPTEFASLIRTDYSRWGKVVQAGKIQLAAQ